MAPSRDPLAQLRRVATSFAAARTPAEERALRRLVGALGAAAAPACLRELASTDPARRRWASELLGEIAREHRDRVLRGLRALLADAAAAGDEAKIDALGLLAELGEATAPTCFTDPAAIQRRSVVQLAEHLGGGAAELAATADMVLRQLPPDDLLDLVDGLAEQAPERAARLIDELTIRLDVDAALRSDLRRIAAPLPRVAAGVTAPAGRPSLLATLRHPSGRAVVAICRRGDGPRRWRALSLLVDERGVLSDAVYDDDCPPQRLGERVVAALLEDGFREIDASFAETRRLVGDAARRAAAAGSLPAGYYLGRDLFALGDLHVAERARPDEHATLLGRAVDLLAHGDPARARPLLERCVAESSSDADAASSLGLCLLALGELDGAQSWLDRAAQLEPGWPLHHWNAAAAAHRAGRTAACYLALRAFVEVGANAGALVRDDGHGHRLDVARRFVSDYERVCRLDGDDPLTRATAERRRPMGPRRARRGAPA